MISHKTNVVQGQRPAATLNDNCGVYVGGGGEVALSMNLDLPQLLFVLLVLMETFVREHVADTKGPDLDQDHAGAKSYILRLPLPMTPVVGGKIRSAASLVIS